jgi:hypothetical protein
MSHLAVPEEAVAVMVGVVARFEFVPGSEAAAEEFFSDGLLVVESQPVTTSWYAYRAGPTTYGAFAVFATEEDREALLSSGGPQAVRSNADLFVRPPTFEKVDVIAARHRG